MPLLTASEVPDGFVEKTSPVNGILPSICCRSLTNSGRGLPARWPLATAGKECE